MSDDRRGIHDSLEPRPNEDAYRVEYDFRTDTPSAIVTEAVAAVAGRAPGELDPLFEVIDPDALDALFEPTMGGRFRGDGQVTFTYHGYEVAVRSYGVIEIRENRDAD